MVDMKSPAFRFYVGDFLLGCRRFSTEEVGAYILLLCEQWDNGAIIPNDENLIKEITKCTKMKVINKVLLKFKKDENGDFFNERLEKERQRQNDFNSKQKANGQKGGRPKSIDNQIDSISVDKPMGLPNESQTQTQKKPSVSASVSNTISKDIVGENPPLPPEFSLDNGIKNVKPRIVFVKPSIYEVKNYFNEYTKSVLSDEKLQTMANAWHDHYTSNGWMVGKNHMKDWKAAVRTWAGRDSKSFNIGAVDIKQPDKPLPDLKTLTSKYEK